MGPDARIPASANGDERLRLFDSGRKNVHANRFFRVIVDVVVVVAVVIVVVIRVTLIAVVIVVDGVVVVHGVVVMGRMSRVGFVVRCQPWSILADGVKEKI